jgi:rod shape-determining protein MreC
MIADHKFNAFSSIKSQINFIVSPVYRVVDFPSAVYQYLNNDNNGKQLTKELLILKSKEQGYNALLLENQRLSKMLGASYSIKDNNYTLARITSISQSRLKKHIIIDKGSSHNIQNNNIVISGNGVVGVVVSVNSHYSTIKLITDPLSYIPVRNTRNGERGIAKGVANNSNNLIIKHNNPEIDIKIGDIFTTSGYGGVFSKNFDVGKVVDITQNNNNFLDIILSPTQIIDNTIFVLVETNL